MRGLHEKPMVVLDESPVVTVGMPVFNGAEHIENALNAILVQTFRDFLLIVSDNASTDGYLGHPEDMGRAR